jgi:predicted Zn-ribbon and HTH transcriptional regulator
VTRRPAQPRERSETVRQAILRNLEEAPLTARELSARVYIREKDVIEHLEHLERSLRHSDRQLRFDAARCLSCGYHFAGRRRLTRPSACPRCRVQHIASPIFRVEPRE